MTGRIQVRNKEGAVFAEVEGPDNVILSVPTPTGERATAQSERADDFFVKVGRLDTLFPGDTARHRCTSTKIRLLGGKPAAVREQNYQTENGPFTITAEGFWEE